MNKNLKIVSNDNKLFFPSKKSPIVNSKKPQNNHDFYLLAEFITSINCERNLNILLKKFSDGAREILSACSVLVEIYDSENGAVIHRKYSRHPEFIDLTYDQIRKNNLINVKLTQEILKTASTFYQKRSVGNSQTDLSNYAVLGFPLSSTVKCHGVVYFIGKYKKKSFNALDKQLGAAMALRLAMLYENIHLHNSLQTTQDLQAKTLLNMENEILLNNEWLKFALEVGQMNIWSWDPQTDKVMEVGLFNKNNVSDKRYSTLTALLNEIHPDDRNQVFKSLRDTASSQQDYDMEFRARLSTGQMEWLAGKGCAFISKVDNSLKVMGVSIKISDRKRMDEQLRQHQLERERIARLSSMGEMSAALAHELNQPLVVIQSYISGCIRQLNSNTEDRQQLLAIMDKLIKQVDLAGKIIHRMKNFVRNGDLSYEVISLNDLINEVLEMLDPDQFNMQLEIIRDIAEGINVEIDRIQIQQVLLNLLHNSIEAMQESVSSERTSLTLIIRARRKSHKTAIIAIEDQGRGFSTTAKNNLFDPYFTTKTNGMGMGLSICRTIIEAHRGKITAQALRRGGSRFQFTLPILKTSQL